MGSPRILGVGEIDHKRDLIGLLGKPEATSHPISVSIYPASEQKDNVRATLGYIGAMEPDPWYSGHKEEWYAQAFIEDDALIKTIQIIERTPPKNVYVSLSLNKGVYRRRRVESSFAGSFEDTYQITNYLCQKIDGWSDSPEPAEGNVASISLAGDTHVIRTDEECESSLPPPPDPTAAALERLRDTIGQTGGYIIALLTALLIGLWLK
jgi:hypothetical protein